uniref:Uncharacterized protein n=1 Tax=Anguilla anguilla TaxID=7936 RepID=A0A0E9UP69_ANGAN
MIGFKYITFYTRLTLHISSMKQVVRNVQASNNIPPLPQQAIANQFTVTCS